MHIAAIDEYNEGGHLIYAQNFNGAFVRGKTREEALQKLPQEIIAYCKWCAQPLNQSENSIEILQKKISKLNICDVDTNIIFSSELLPLTEYEYKALKKLALKSASDFLALYNSVPIKSESCLPARTTFYGQVPITANDMYEHTKNVNSYYFGEIHISADNKPDIYSCRLSAFSALEETKDYLCNEVYLGRYSEEWSLRKVFRRFIWHDRIHAKAMYRMAVKLCGELDIANPFFF